MKNSQVVEGLWEHWSEYHHQSRDTANILEVLPEVEVAHPLIDQIEGVCFCGPPSNKGYDIWM